MPWPTVLAVLSLGQYVRPRFEIFPFTMTDWSRLLICLLYGTNNKNEDVLLIAVCFVLQARNWPNWALSENDALQFSDN